VIMWWQRARPVMAVTSIAIMTLGGCSAPPQTAEGERAALLQTIRTRSDQGPTDTPTTQHGHVHDAMSMGAGTGSGLGYRPGSMGLPGSGGLSVGQGEGGY